MLTSRGVSTDKTQRGKTFGYCWSSYFQAIRLLLLRWILAIFGPSTKVCPRHDFRHWGVDQQYPFVFFLTIAHERMKRCFLYACYGNPFTLSLRLPYELFSAPSPEPPLIARGGCPWSMPSLRAIT
jgi:hypothetical protein